MAGSLLPIGGGSATDASLGGLLKTGKVLIEKGKPIAQAVGNLISVGVVLEKVDRTLRDSSKNAQQKATVLFNALVGRLKISPITRYLSFDELVNEGAAASGLTPNEVRAVLIQVFLDP